MKGKIKACERGFHFCEHPLDVFGYYPPGLGSRYHEVTGEGNESRDGQDTKVATSKISIGVSMSLKAMIDAAIKFTFDRVKWEDGDKATGYQGAAVALGIEGKAKAKKGGWIVVAQWKYDENCNWQRVDMKCAQVDGETIKEDQYYRLVNGEFVAVD